MSHWQPLHTPCGIVQAWLAEPEGSPRGAVVVAHEIFGLLPHYQRLCTRLAEAGFVALAPAYFDLIEPGLTLPTDTAGADRGREVVNRLGLDCAVDVTETAAQWLQARGQQVGVVGFSWGGTVALLANTRLRLPAVSYYATRNPPFLDEPAQAPLMFHFGALDVPIPPAIIDQHRHKQPNAQAFVYDDADHGFNREPDPPFQPDAAALAWRRTLALFGEHLS